MKRAYLSVMFMFVAFQSDGTGEGCDLEIAAGKSALKSGKKADAEASFQDAIFVAPKDSRGYLLLANLLLERNALDGVLQLSEQMSRQLPDSHLPSFLSGKAWQVKGETRKSIRAFEQSVKMSPRHAKSWFALGNLYEVNGSPVEKTTLAFATFIKESERRGDDFYEAERKLRKLRPQLLSWRQNRERIKTAYGRALIEAGLSKHFDRNKEDEDYVDRVVSEEDARTKYVRLQTERVLLVRDALSLLPRQLHSEVSSPKAADTALILEVLNFYLDKAWNKRTPAELRPLVYEDALKFCQRVKKLEIQSPELQRSLGLTTSLALYLSKAYPLAQEVFSRIETQPSQVTGKPERQLEDRVEKRSLETLMKTRGLHHIKSVGLASIGSVSFQHFILEGEIDSRQMWEEETWIEIHPDSGLGRIFALVSVPAKSGRSWILYDRSRGQENVIKIYGEYHPGAQVHDQINQHLSDGAKNFAPSGFRSVIADMEERLRDVEQSISELEAHPPSMSPLDLVADGTAFISAQVTGMILPQTYVHPVRLDALLPDVQKRMLRSVKVLPIQTRDGWVKVHYQQEEAFLYITKVETE